MESFAYGNTSHMWSYVWIVESREELELSTLGEDYLYK